MNFENLEVKVFKALAHPIRLKIIKNLAQQTLCVCEMNENVDFSQSNLSQHLKVLREAGIVVCEKDGLRINYRIKNTEVLEVIQIIEAMVLNELIKVSQSIEK